MTKKKDTKSKVQVTDIEIDPFQALYAMLIMVHAVEHPSDIYTRYAFRGGNISVAIPGIKYGIAFNGDDIDAFTKDGWHIERINTGDLKAFASVFKSIDNSRIAKLYAKSDPNIKTTSIPEEKIFSEIQRRLLPIPDRNYKFLREDGSELTTPDFTWVDEKIAFFMDGAYWHSVKSDNDIMKEIAKNKKFRDDIASKRKDKVINDNQIRTELTVRGWRVLICSDEELETSNGVMKVVDNIEKAIKSTQYAKEIKKDNIDQESEDIIDSIFEEDYDTEENKGSAVDSNNTNLNSTVNNNIDNTNNEHIEKPIEENNVEDQSGNTDSDSDSGSAGNQHIEEHDDSTTSHTVTHLSNITYLGDNTNVLRREDSHHKDKISDDVDSAKYDNIESDNSSTEDILDEVLGN